MFTLFLGHIQMRVSVLRRAYGISASTPSMASNTCDALKILSQNVLYLCDLLIERKTVTCLLTPKFTQYFENLTKIT